MHALTLEQIRRDEWAIAREHSAEGSTIFLLISCGGACVLSMGVVSSGGLLRVSKHDVDDELRAYKN